MTENDDVIRRSTGERFATLKVFGILGFLGLMLGLLAFVLPSAVMELVFEADQKTTNWTGLGFGIPVLVFVCVGIVRSYRRRAGHGLRVLPDRVERIRGSGATAIPADDLLVYVFRDSNGQVERVTFRARTGKTFDLFQGEWPVSKVAEEVERVLVPSLTERARAALVAGEPVTFPERPSWSASTVILATVMVLTGLVILLVGPSDRLDGRQLARLGKFVAVAVIGAGAFLIRVLRLRGGGITLTRTGVSQAGEGAEQETPLADILSFVAHSDGVQLEGVERQYHLSSSGANFGVLASLLKDYRAKKRPPTAA